MFSFRFPAYCCLPLTTKQSIGNCHWYSRFLQGLFSLPNSDRSLTALSLSQMICFLHHLISLSPLFLCYPATCFFIYFFQLFRQLYLYLSVIIIFLLICVFLSPLLHFPSNSDSGFDFKIIIFTSLTFSTLSYLWNDTVFIGLATHRVDMI